MNVEKSMNQTKDQTALPEVSVQPFLCALSERYATRGVAKAVKLDAEAQQEREEKNRELAPDAYRLSALSDEAVKARYCHGDGEDMTASDLVSYFDETRAMRLKDVDFSEESEEELTEEAEETALAVQDPAKRPASQKLKGLPAGMLAGLKQSMPKWFDTRAADRSENRKTFPLSAFAAVAAVAASLMLIVASSVMVTQAEARVSNLQDQIDSVSLEVADLDADFNVQHDLLQIRKIAIEEYGMVSEEYVRMDYVSLAGEDRVETFQEDTEESVGLTALLSAIGAFKQN